jgi:hypothetical protein
MKLHLQLTIKDMNSGTTNGSTTAGGTTNDSKDKKADKKADKTSEASTQETKPKAILPGNPIATLFKDVKIKLNGVTVTESHGLYPYVSQHLFLTKIPPVYRKAVETSGRIYYDHEWTKAISSGGKKVVGFTDDLWKDINDRQAWYGVGSKNPVDICAYLFTDLTSSPQSVVVPPNVSVEIELHPNSSKKCILLTETGKIEPVVSISKASLIVPRVTPSHSIPPSIMHKFMRVSAQPIFIPESTTNYHKIVTFSGPIPSRLSLVFASMQSFDGNYAENMYSSNPHSLKQIDFNVAGRHYPAVPIMANFTNNEQSEMYLRTAESLRFSLEKTQMALPSLYDYAERAFIYSIDISDDYSTDSNWVPSDETGSVSISLQFAQPTTEQLVGILIAESVATMNIPQNNDVNVE